MAAYFLYIRDERYQTPTMVVMTAASDEAVVEIARARLAASPHYLSAEVWEDNRLVANLDKDQG